VLTSHTSAFGDLLRRHRLAAGLTQEALAERAGVSVRAVSDLERAVKTRPHRDTIRLLADALGLTSRDRAVFEATTRHSGGPGSPVSDLSLLPSPGVSLPLVGRDRELALLERRLAGEGPPVWLLAGEPGIGKSRLLYEAPRRAGEQGWSVLMGGCQRRGGQESYAPLLQALDGHIRAQTPARLRVSLRGCAWLVRLVPELAGGPIESLPAWTVSPEQERRLLVKAVARYLANVAGPSGTLLVLDDLQWAGPDALGLLATLIRSAEAPLGVIGAYRDTEVGPQDPLSVALADLAQAGLAAQHALSPLSPPDAAHLLEALLPGATYMTSELRQRVVQRTGGVPFFVISCAHALRAQPLGIGAEDAVPWDVAQGIRQRVAALPEDTRHVLSVAAVLGRRIPYVLLRQVTACAEDEVLTALETARHGRLLLEVDRTSYQFAHDLIREVIEADLGAARRAMLHRRAAEALEQAPGEPPVEQLAYHYSHSDEQDKAALYEEQAGDRASSLYANGMAESYYRELVDSLDRLGRTHDSARAREKLGGALSTVTRYDEALALLEQAAAVYRAAGDGQGELRTIARIGRAHAWRGTPAEGIVRLWPVLESHRADRPSPALAVAYVALARLFFYTGRYTDEMAAAERTAELAAMLNDARILAEAEQRRGVAMLMQRAPIGCRLSGATDVALDARGELGAGAALTRQAGGAVGLLSSRYAGAPRPVPARDARPGPHARRRGVAG